MKALQCSHGSKQISPDLWREGYIHIGLVSGRIDVIGQVTLGICLRENVTGK